MRTCVGCRVRAAKATLLRVVAIEGVLVPDPASRLPGRGASVHPDLQCVALADKRRAFPRALRLPGALDVTPVREHVAGLHGATARPDAPVTAPVVDPPPAPPAPDGAAPDGPARGEQAP